MDAYFPKTRRPTMSANLSAAAINKKLLRTPTKSSPIKRPPSADEPRTPPRALKIPTTPSTPKDAKLSRPTKPPPVKRKLYHHRSTEEHHEKVKPVEENKFATPIKAVELHKSLPTLSPTRASLALASATSPNAKKRPVTARELFKTVQPSKKIVELRTLDKSPKLSQAKPPDKISSGPLRGIETSLLDLIRKKEADAKNIDPERERRRELLGIAPEIVRTVPTIFIANKKEVLPYDRVVDKCFRGLKTNYTTATIIECLQLLDKIVPEWVSVVQVSRGKFMRFNKDKYTIPHLLEAIERYKKINFN